MSWGSGTSLVLLLPLVLHFLTRTEPSIRSSVFSERHSLILNPDKNSNLNSTAYLWGTDWSSCSYSDWERILDFPFLWDFIESSNASVGWILPIQWMQWKFHWNTDCFYWYHQLLKLVGLMGLNLGSNRDYFAQNPLLYLIVRQKSV